MSNYTLKNCLKWVFPGKLGRDMLAPKALMNYINILLSV